MIRRTPLPLLLPALLAWLLLGSSCSRIHTPGKDAADATKTPAAAISLNASEGDIRARLTVTPGVADLTADNLMSLEVEAPSQIDIDLPPLTGRLSGLTAPNGTFDDPVVSVDGTRVWRRHARLVPVVGTEYRIAPLVIRYTDAGSSPPREGWFTTPPLVLPLEPLSATPATSITTTIPQHWIRPPNRIILQVAAAILLGLGLLAAAILLVRRLRRRTRLASLTPRQRALEELERLLHANLLKENRIKDFYVELTMVVRRYIERQHRVRAPEQTTEEFLRSVAGNPHFAPDVVDRLQAFLQAADLVKFAAQTPAAADIDHAIQTARRYVETDADTLPPPEGGA